MAEDTHKTLHIYNLATMLKVKVKLGAARGLVLFISVPLAFEPMIASNPLARNTEQSVTSGLSQSVFLPKISPR